MRERFNTNLAMSRRNLCLMESMNTAANTAAPRREKIQFRLIGCHGRLRDLKREQIVIDPLTGAMGYGIEYTYSVMERIRRLFEAALQSAGLPRVTFSAGVALLDGEDADGPALVKRADQALYRAKREGKNRVLVAGE